MNTSTLSILVCGGRQFADRPMLDRVMDELLRQHGPFTVISGCAEGADTLAIDWAEANNLPVRRFPADWDTHGKAAGPIRNRQMLEEGKPDLVVAFPGRRGTAHMVRISRDAGVEVLTL